MDNKEQSLIPKVFTHESFGKLRIVVIDGVIYFVAIDVARALGYKNGSRDVNRHVDEADRLEYRLFVSAEPEVPGGTAGQTRKVTLINKSGVYSLILDSNMPKAKEYRHWVTSEVLPSIHETGSYSAVEAPTAPLALPKSKRSEAQLADARVYVLLMSNNTVKIGLSGKLRPRVSKIKRDNNLTVKDIYFSPLMSREDARLIEWACQEKFSSRCVQGEFFSATFEEACAAIDTFAESLRLLPNASKKIFISTKQIADKKID